LAFEVANAVRLASDYADSISEVDISRVDGIDKNPNRVRRLLRSLARNESSAPGPLSRGSTS
jgi:hypothetical protein